MTIATNSTSLGYCTKETLFLSSTQRTRFVILWFFKSIWFNSFNIVLDGVVVISEGRPSVHVLGQIHGPGVNSNRLILESSVDSILVFKFDACTNSHKRDYFYLAYGQIDNVKTASTCDIWRGTISGVTKSQAVKFFSFNFIFFWLSGST